MNSIIKKKKKQSPHGIKKGLNNIIILYIFVYVVFCVKYMCVLCPNSHVCLKSPSFHLYNTKNNLSIFVLLVCYQIVEAEGEGMLKLPSRLPLRRYKQHYEVSQSNQMLKQKVEKLNDQTEGSPFVILDLYAAFKHSTQPSREI
nr:GDSL esterase/lipase At5g03610-like isoform X2 [Ipomoea trifida]